jgi:hypothetical protein
MRARKEEVEEILAAGRISSSFAWENHIPNVLPAYISK